jgi:cytochrome c5
MNRLFILMFATALLAVPAMAHHMDPETIAKRIAPVGKVYREGDEIPNAAPAAAAGTASVRSGEQVYQTACAACHGTGAAGAPKFGDAAAWAPRAEKGMDTLLNHAVNGFNAMPPKGLCADCSDDELKAAIEYMVGHSK